MIQILVGGATFPSWKMMGFVNGQDDIPCVKWKIIQPCLKPPTRYLINHCQPLLTTINHWDVWNHPPGLIHGSISCVLTCPHGTGRLRAWEVSRWACAESCFSRMDSNLKKTGWISRDFQDLGMSENGVYPPKNSHLWYGIVWSLTIGCRGTLFSDKPISGSRMLGKKKGYPNGSLIAGIEIDGCWWIHPVIRFWPPSHRSGWNPDVENRNRQIVFLGFDCFEWFRRTQAAWVTLCKFNFWAFQLLLLSIVRDGDPDKNHVWTDSATRVTVYAMLWFNWVGSCHQNSKLQRQKTNAKFSGFHVKKFNRKWRSGRFQCTSPVILFRSARRTAYFGTPWLCCAAAWDLSPGYLGNHGTFLNASRTFAMMLWLLILRDWGI